MREHIREGGRISYTTVEERSRHDIVACSCNGADGHELRCMAACSSYGSHAALKGGDSFFEYLLREFTGTGELIDTPNRALLGHTHYGGVSDT